MIQPTTHALAYITAPDGTVFVSIPELSAALEQRASAWEAAAEGAVADDVNAFDHAAVRAQAVRAFLIDLRAVETAGAS